LANPIADTSPNALIVDSPNLSTLDKISLFKSLTNTELYPEYPVLDFCKNFSLYSLDL
jgi:hypothetical protein